MRKRILAGFMAAVAGMSGMMAIHGEDPAAAGELLGPVNRMLVVTGKKTEAGITAVPRGKSLVAVVRQRVKAPAGILQFSGKVSGNTAAVNISIIAKKQGKKSFQKACWLNEKALVRSEDGTKSFGGALDCTGMIADEIYFYFEGFVRQEGAVVIHKLSLQEQKD